MFIKLRIVQKVQNLGSDRGSTVCFTSKTCNFSRLPFTLWWEQKVVLCTFGGAKDIFSWLYLWMIQVMCLGGYTLRCTILTMRARIMDSWRHSIFHAGLKLVLNLFWQYYLNHSPASALLFPTSSRSHIWSHFAFIGTTAGLICLVSLCPEAIVHIIIM